MNENRKIPELRFPEYTDDWKDYRIGELFDERREKMPDGELLSVTIKDGIKKHSESGRRDSSSDDKSNYKKVCVGDIAYNSMRMWQGASGFSEYEGIISPAYTVIKPKENVDARCAAYLFKRKKMTNIFQRHSQGVASDTWNLKYPELSQIHIMFPRNVAEQHRISSFFSKIDSVIVLQQQYVDQLKEFKKGCLQKMFPKKGEKVPEMRFPGFTDYWEQRKLGECFSSLQNNTLSRAELSDENGVAMNVHYGDVLIKFDECLDVSKEVLPFIEKQSIADKFKTSYLQNGDVIVADTAEDETVGKCTEIMGLTGQKVISGLHTIPLRPNEEFATGYLGFYLNSAAYHDQLKPLMQGIKVTSISKSAMHDTIIRYPSDIKEQELIGRYFISLDRLITLHQRKLNEMKEFKKGCLQKMFV